jgi:hypothetical protein
MQPFFAAGFFRGRTASTSELNTTIFFSFGYVIARLNKQNERKITIVGSIKTKFVLFFDTQPQSMSSFPIDSMQQQHVEGGGLMDLENLRQAYSSSESDTSKCSSLIIEHRHSYRLPLVS